MQESPKGRGSHLNPPNRFGGLYHVQDLEQVENDEEYLASLGRPPTEYIPDKTRSVVSQNDSPDVGFRYSVNPYRGCSHGCAYCYARPTHEYLGLNAGLDFETKILVKHEAPELLRDFLSRDEWQPESIALSGVTDPYQPAERQFRITRGCIEVALEARQPISIITKNALVVRDLDLFQEMAKRNLVHVNVSITTLSSDLARTMEPRTSVPEARLRAVSELAQAGVPVRVLVAPIIPGLNDSEIPMILKASKEAGATDASYILVRLPWTVRPVFLEWLARTHPTQKDRIEGRIRAVREGKLNDPEFGGRMTGKGEIADRIRDLFHVFQKKYGIDSNLPPYNCEDFRPPLPRSGQGRLF
jgi:DNA repair photolyase